MDFSKIKAFAFDIDGVMTDGGIMALPDGDLLRVFDAKDAFALRMAALNGFTLATITGGRSESIRKRMKICGVKEDDIYLNSRCKIRDFEDFCDRHSFEAEEVMYFGDDIPDVEVLKVAGIGVAPSDACIEAKAAADLVSPFPGGKWCVRDTVEQVLRAQGKWQFDSTEYEKVF